MDKTRIANRQIVEDLRKWFDKDHPKGGWKRYNTKGEAIGDCAREEGEGTPKCLSNEKAAKMTKKERAAAVKRKRKKDPVADKRGKGNKPKMVSNNIRENSMENINIRGVFPDMILEINEEPCVVESVNRLGDKTYVVSYIKENKERGKEFFLINEYATVLDEVEPVDLNEEKDSKKPLNKIQRGGSKKFYVYVKNDKGNVVKVSFGDKNMEIKRDDPNRRKNFRARHNCDNPGPKWKARYWACKTWEKGKSVSDLTEEVQELNEKNVPTNPSLWSRAKALAKKKFDVYPSAYANGWASKWYKKRGGKWKTESKKKVNEGYLDTKRLDAAEKERRDDLSKQLKSMNVLKTDKGRNKLAQVIMGAKRLYTKDQEENNNEDI